MRRLKEKFVFVNTIASVLVCCSMVADLACGEDEQFPTAVRGKTAVQMKPLVERAAAENMIISDITVRASRSRQLFECTFEQNTNNISWLIVLNLKGAELKKQQPDLATKKYFPVIERSVMFQGQELHTVVWHRKAEDRPLVLPAGPTPESGLVDNSLKPLDDMMRSFITRHNVAGATLAVAKDGRLVYSRGFGFANIEKNLAMRPDAVMRIASISKSLTGVATLMLVADGKLSLDENILPRLQARGFQLVRTADQRWNEITVRHLLQHSGGWDRDVSPDPMFQVVNITRKRKLKRPADRDNIVRYQMTQPLDFAPGDRHAYSNFGYSLLAQIIEEVTDMDYDEFVTQRILVPCQMQQTRPGKTRLEDAAPDEARYYTQTISTHTPFWSVPEQARRGSDPKIPAPVEAPYGQWDLEVMDAHGGWTSSTPDLLKFARALDTEQAPLLSEASLTTMLERPALKTASPKSQVWYGCGWNVRSAGSDDKLLGRHNIWHDGTLAGTSTLLVRRNDGFSWAILFNTDQSVSGDKLASLIDFPIHSAVDSVTDWPEYDLFEKK